MKTISLWKSVTSAVNSSILYTCLTNTKLVFIQESKHVNFAEISFKINNWLQIISKRSIFIKIKTLLVMIVVNNIIIIQAYVNIRIIYTQAHKNAMFVRRYCVTKQHCMIISKLSIIMMKTYNAHCVIMYLKTLKPYNSTLGQCTNESFEATQNSIIVLIILL